MRLSALDTTETQGQLLTLPHPCLTLPHPCLAPPSPLSVTPSRSLPAVFHPLSPATSVSSPPPLPSIPGACSVIPSTPVNAVPGKGHRLLARPLPTSAFLEGPFVITVAAAPIKDAAGSQMSGDPSLPICFHYNRGALRLLQPCQRLGAEPYGWVLNPTAGCRAPQMGAEPHSWMPSPTDGCRTPQLGAEPRVRVLNHTAGC